jgi:hypothetical protein
MTPLKFMGLSDYALAILNFLFDTDAHVHWSTWR